MTRSTVAALLGASAVLAGACGGDSAPSPDRLAGTWQATRIAYASSSGLGTVDIVARGGSASLVLGSDSTLQFTLRQPNGASGAFSGTYTTSVDLLSVTVTSGDAFAGLNMGWAFSLAGSSLQISCGPDTGTGPSDNCAFVLDHGMSNGFDFNADGALERATWTITLTR